MRDKIMEDLHSELESLEHSINREWEHLQSESKYKYLDGIYPFINNIKRYEAQKSFVEYLINNFEVER